MWKRFFKGPQNRLDFINDSAFLNRVPHYKGHNIIHVVNFVAPETIKNSEFARRLQLTLESIELSTIPEVTHLGCCTTEMTEFRDWKMKLLKRNAQKALGSAKDFAFLKDMFKAALELAQTGDIIFYSNLDCPLSPSLYKNLLNQDEGAVEFIRRDVRGPRDYEAIFQLPFENYEIGVDGVALKKETLETIFPQIPDMVIGEPHWDTALSGILHKNFVVKQNTSDLYHIWHPQQWDDANLSPGGEHNKKLYRAAVQRGLMEDQLISIDKDWAVVLLKHTLESPHDDKIAKNLQFLESFRPNLEKLFCEYGEGESYFKKYINNVSYLPIAPRRSSDKKINQKNALLNLLHHYFINHRYIIIALENTLITPEALYQLKDRLQVEKKIITEEYVALCPEFCSLREFDIFVENELNYPKIKEYSFINDCGLLELFDHYA